MICNLVWAPSSVVHLLLLAYLPARFPVSLFLCAQWVEFLCFDINVHVPHHVMSKIPWYNLRAATDSLRQNWGEYMTEATFNWRMLKVRVFSTIH